MEQMEQLKKNFQYYLDNYDELVKKYDGKVLVIVNQQVAESCDTEAEAHAIGKEKYGMGNFLIQRCSSKQKTYNVVFRNRVRITNNEAVYPTLCRV